MRKFSLALVALALVAMFSVAKAPAHAYQLNGCTTEWVEGYPVTAKVVDPGNLSNTTIFAEGCEVGVLLTHGGQTVNNDTIIGGGDGYGVAGIVVTGSFTSYLTHDTVTNFAVGIFDDYSTMYVNYATLTGNGIGIYAYADNTNKITLTNSNIFSNLVGVDAYLAHLTASYNNVHENFYAGYITWGGYGSSSHDSIWGNQGGGFVSVFSSGGYTLAYDNIQQNGYQNPCSAAPVNDGPLSIVIECVGNELYICFLGFEESFTPAEMEYLFAGVEGAFTKLTLNHTSVRYNATGVVGFGFGTTVYIYNYSTVCVNHHGPTDSNFLLVYGATGSVSSTSHVCLP